MIRASVLLDALLYTTHHPAGHAHAKFDLAVPQKSDTAPRLPLAELLSDTVRFVELLQNMVMRPLNLSQKFKPSEMKASHCYIFHDRSQGLFIARMKKVILVLFL